MKKVLLFAGIGMTAVGVGMVLFSLLSGPKGSVGEFSQQMTVKEKVISGVYKAYGVKDTPVPMWLAKTVFRNNMNARITNLKVRYKVTEYSDWCSWHQYAAVDPTQTVVDLYYPIFTAACVHLTSRAPSELQMEGEYTDARGMKHTFSDTRRLTMLSRFEFIFSDLTAEERTSAFQDQDTYSPLMAAWVSRSDDVVARLASMANKKAGGLGASSNDESCIKVMAELYEIMRTIHISYQHPQVLQDKGLSYDIKSVQSLQYPRDTIQKRSGTCIDLAILYAAMLNSVNIKPYLVSMDGHCFPMGQTPSGKFIPVEATGVGDGYDKSMDFEKAVKSALETWQKVNNNGRFNLVDVRQYWVQGIANPELDALPPDILEKWGVVALVEGASAPAVRESAAPGVPISSSHQVAPQPASVTVTGRWGFSMTGADGRVYNGLIQISGKGGQLQLVATATYSAMGPDGRSHQLQEKNDFVGALQGQNLVAQCNVASLKVDGYKSQPSNLPYRLNLVVAPDGRSMQGQVSNASGASAPIILQRQ
jgi:hypothetical protein